MGVDGRAAAGALVGVLCALITGCAVTVPGAPVEAGGGAPARPATVVELAAAIHGRQLDDVTMGLTVELFTSSELGFAGGGVPTGSGAYRVTELRTDSRHEIATGDGSAAVVVVGSEVFSAIGRPGDAPGTGDAPWTAQPLSEAMDGVSSVPAMLHRNTLWLTEPDALGDVFTLDGSADEERDGDPVVRHRLSAVAAEAAELIDLQVGLAATDRSTAAGTVLIDLVVDDMSRLVEASVTLGTPGEDDFGFRYVFSRWGEPVDITAPPVDQIG